MSDHVAKHVEGKLGVTVQHAGVEAGVLLGRVGVELPPTDRSWPRSAPRCDSGFP